VWVTLGCVAFAAPAHAEAGPPKRAPQAEHALSLLAGHGAGERFDDDAKNRYGLALGARAGLTFAAPRVYLGLSFLHFSGYDEPSQRVHVSTLDGELGYELRLLQDRLLFRPQLALGLGQPTTIQPDNAGYPLAFHWAPGVLLGVRFTPVLFSAEYRRDFIPERWPSAHTALFGCGLML
jgi:hypothetical protein